MSDDAPRSRTDRIPIRVYVTRAQFEWIKARADPFGQKPSTPASMILTRVLSDPALIQAVFSPLLEGAASPVSDVADNGDIGGNSQSQPNATVLADVAGNGANSPHSSICPSVHSSTNPSAGEPAGAERGVPAKSAKKKRRGKRSAQPYTPEFEAWYAVYPRHEAKAAGAKAFEAALKTIDIATVVAGAEAYASQVKDECRPKNKIAHPATWLNGRRWEDQAEPNTPRINYTVKPNQSQLDTRERHKRAEARRLEEEVPF